MRAHTIAATTLLMMLIPALAQQDQQSNQPTANDEAKATAFVRTFFGAIDAHDADKIEGLLLPSATIVQPNGKLVDKQEFLSNLRGVKEWPPRTRELSNFTVYTLGEGIVVGCTNHVVFHPATSAPFEHTFTETWILKRTDSGLKALRAHYSRVGPIDNFGVGK